jgi:DNA polymerase IIIc chi subunit
VSAVTHAAHCANFKQAKLADFGLHKRVRRLVSSGALVAWNQDTTYRGAEYEPSFYGGNLYLTNAKSAFSAAGSSRDEGSVHGSAGGSLHGSLHGAGGARAALNAASNGNAATATAAEDGGGFGSSSGSGVLMGRRRNTSVSDLQSLPEAPHDDAAAAAAAAASNSGLAKPPVYPGSQQQQQQVQELLPSSSQPGAPGVSYVPHSDSATSIQQVAPVGLAAAQQQQQQQHLMSAVRAKSQGLLGKQDFVTRVLSAQPELLGVSAFVVAVRILRFGVLEPMCVSWHACWSMCFRSLGATNAASTALKPVSTAEPASVRTFAPDLSSASALAAVACALVIVCYLWRC